MKSARTLGLVSVLSFLACGSSPVPQTVATQGAAPKASPPSSEFAPRATPAAALLVLAKRDEMMAIVDPKTLEVVAKIPVGHDPHEVVASPDGTLAYVSNYGGGSLNTLAAVDLVAQKALPAIDLGALHGPHGLAYAGDKVWFTTEGSKTIGSYDPKNTKIDWILGTGQDRTHMIIVAPDLTHLYTSNVSSGTLSFIEKNNKAPDQGPPMGPRGGDWQQTLVDVGAGTEGFDLSPNGQEIWAADAQDGSVAVVDVASKKLTQRIDAKIHRANRLKFSHDGKWVFVSSLGGGDVVVFDAAKKTEAKRIAVGHGAAGILMQPDGARAYVACSPDGYVAVIDLKSMSVTAKVKVGSDPDGLAWAQR
jgi:YVTN family beta-propeller protein